MVLTVTHAQPASTVSRMDPRPALTVEVLTVHLAPAVAVLMRPSTSTTLMLPGESGTMAVQTVVAAPMMLFTQLVVPVVVSVFATTLPLLS